MFSFVPFQSTIASRTNWGLLVASGGCGAKRSPLSGMIVDEFVNLSTISTGTDTISLATGCP